MTEKSCLSPIASSPSFMLASQVPSSTAARFFSSSDDQVDTYDHPDYRLYERAVLNRSLPVSDSVDRLLEVPVGQMHPLDFYNKCPNMMKLSCKLGHLEDAYSLLKRMLREKRVSARVVPAKAFEICIFGHARVTAHQHPKQAIREMMNLVKLMGEEDEYDQFHCKADTNDSCQPTAHTFNTFLTGMAAAARNYPKAAHEAQDLLEKMKEMHRTKGWHCRPNTRSYTLVITAYGNMERFESGDLAQAVLDKMKEASESEQLAYEAQYGVPYDKADPTQNKRIIITPDASAHSAVILAYAKGGARGSPAKAYDLLMEMERPDAVAITSTIQAYAKLAGKSSGKFRDRRPAQERFQAAEKAESLLLLMEELAQQEAESRNENEDETDNQVESDETDDKHDLEGDVDLAWYEDSDDEDDNSTNDYDDKPEAGSMRPTVVTYNAGLNAWARSDTQEAAPRADALLKRMIESAQTNDNAVKPDRTSFNTVLNAWARFSRYDPKAPEKADDLLNEMYDLYDSGRLERVKPDAISYTTVINAWARAGDRPDKTLNARRLLDDMLSKYDSDESDMKPSILAYTSVLNSAAHINKSSSSTNDEQDPFTSVTTHEEEGPYTIALQTYYELLNDPYNLGITPDHFVFATMLQVIQRHTDKTSAERRQMVETVFDEACAAGQVSSFVVRALRNACPSVDLLERLLRSRKLAKHIRNVSQLPDEWSRNVDRVPRLRFVDDAKRGRDGRRK